MTRRISRRKLLGGATLASVGLALSTCFPHRDDQIPTASAKGVLPTPSLTVAETPSTAPTSPTLAEETLEPTPQPSNTRSPTDTPTSTATTEPTAAPTATSVPATDTPATGVSPADTPTSTVYLPKVTRAPVSLGPRVVHVRSPNATHWSGETDYWNYIDQDVVSAMVDDGVMSLTQTTTLADAWHALLPAYRSGEALAIKVNLNNSTSCDDADGQIDALIQPVNAIVRGLKLIGLAESDIWVYDAIRPVPDRFVDGNQYAGVRFFDQYCRSPARWDSDDPDAYVAFSAPSDIPDPPDTRISDVLIDASYVINMPIVKTHGHTGVTLAFKNHFGSIDSPSGLHPYLAPWEPYYKADYSPLVDLYRNPHITGKTVLTVGDGLFAAPGHTSPQPWATFANQVPNSLFFSTDPVAIDCVMCDLVAAEEWIYRDYADFYLRLAGDVGLGIFERGDPWGSGYRLIDYAKVEF